MKCFCATVRHSARLLTRYYEEALRPANLTPAQFELLSTLSAARGLPQSYLAKALGVDQTTLSRNMKLLIARKWVDCGPSSKDRRQTTYSLTADGRKAWSDALPHWRVAQAAMEREFGEDGPAIWSSLARVASAVDAAEAKSKEVRPAANRSGVAL